MMDMLQLTKQLVGFPSPSHESNADISEFLVGQLRAMDFDIETVEYDDARGTRKVNVLGRKGPDNDAPGFAYFCRMVDAAEAKELVVQLAP